MKKMNTPKSILFCAILVTCSAEEFKVTPITTSSGLYYENIGDALLSNSKWQFVTSVDYHGYLLFYEYLLNQARKIEEFCQKANVEECDNRYESIRSNLERIKERDESMANFLGITRPRVKRGFFSAIGNFFRKIGGGLVGAVKMIFGGGSRQIDLSVYDRQLGDLRSGQRNLENQLNLQRTAFLLDSEKKNFQIEWLKKTQGDIQNQVAALEGNFQKDSKKKEQEIKELNKMLEETREKLKMQEEIQKKLGNRVSEIEDKLLKVDEDINKISEQVEGNTLKISHNKLVIKLNSISIDFGFLLTQFEEEQKTLFEVIKNANRGDLDPYILTPLNMVEMLQNIQPHLPEDMKFPFYPNIENANKLYNLIKPSVYLYNSTVIFILQIPLVHARTYRIHKMTSLPLSVDSKKFVFIQPQEPFLIIDKNYQEYALMSSTDFREYCHKIGEWKYLCKQIHQVSLAYENQECEVALFKTAREIPSSCDSRLIHLDKPIFLQLQQPKAWVYAVPDMEILTFNCGNDRSTVNLRGAGFIELKTECIVHTPKFELLSLLEYTNSVKSNYSAPLNLTSIIDMSYVEEVEEISPVRKEVILPFDLEELNKISFSTKRIETSSVSLYIVLILLIVIAIVLGYFIYKRKITVESLQESFSCIKKTNYITGHSNTDAEKVQIRMKLKKGEDNIERISVRQDPSSTDPESEYLTVRFKVKKDAVGPLTTNKGCDKSEGEPSSKNTPPGFSGEDGYLSHLRRLKPSNKMNDYQI